MNIQFKSHDTNMYRGFFLFKGDENMVIDT